MNLKECEELKARAQVILTQKRSEYSVSKLDVEELIEKGNKYNTDILTQVSMIREYIKQREAELNRLPLDDISQLESSKNYAIKLFDNTNVSREETRKCYEENIAVLEGKHIKAIIELKLNEQEGKFIAEIIKEPQAILTINCIIEKQKRLKGITELIPVFQQTVCKTLEVLHDTRKVAKEEDESLRLERDNLERTIQDITVKIDSFGRITEKREELSEDITNFERQIIKVKLNINSFEKMIKGRQKRLHTLLSDVNRAQLRVDEIKEEEKTNE